MAAQQRIPATLDLVGDYSLRWGRTFTVSVALFSDVPGGVVLSLDGVFTGYQCEIRTRTTDETLIVTGSAVADTPSNGIIDLTFPASGWPTGPEQLGTHKLDVVGINGAGNDYPLLEGRAEVRTSTTLVVTP